MVLASRNVGAQVAAIGQQNAQDLAKVIQDIVMTPVTLTNALLAPLMAPSTGAGLPFLPPLPEKSIIEVMGLPDPVAPMIRQMAGQGVDPGLAPVQPEPPGLFGSRVGARPMGSQDIQMF